MTQSHRLPYRITTRRPRSKPNTRRAIPSAIRTAIFERDSYACVICGATDRLEIDHIRPRAKGGSDEADNLQTLCKTCNIAKSDHYEVAA